MANTEITPCLNKLEYMLLSDVDSLHEVEDQLWSLHCMLTRLSSFLMEVQRKQSVDFMEQRQKAMEKFAMEVMTLVRGAEDDTDSYLNTIRREGLLSPTRDEAREDMRSQIKKTMEALKDSHSRFVRSTQSYCASGTSLSSKRRPPPPIYQDDDDDDEVVVGLEDEFRKMLDLLLLGEEEEEEKDTRRGRCNVIPIVGPGGMGKTTLARRVYNHPAIVEYFVCRLWIYVSRDYKLEEVLQDIIEQIKWPTTAVAKEDEIRQEEEKMSLKDLAFQTKKLLETTPTRYLLVFDDVCKTQFWADIHMVFSNNKNKRRGGGSRIIFTTRHDAVASHARPYRPPFYLRRLSKEESRELFSKRVAGFLQHNSCSPSQRNIIHDDEDPHRPWEAWVDACGGIPVTIVALAAVYQRLMLTDHNYKEMEEKGLVKIWKLIYNHLPHHLKACLAYFYFLQKAMKVSYIFDLFDFKGLIVAEGLVKPLPPSTTIVELEDIAEEYVKELISRKLIQVTEWSIDGKIEYTIIPDWLVSLLDQINGITSSSDDDVNVNSSKMKIQNVKNLGGWVMFDEDYLSCSSTLKARSLAVSSSSIMSTESERSLCLQDMGSLRVVINLGSPTESDIISYTRIDLMIHLRYLYLSASRSCSPRTITEYLSELWNLQFLEIIGPGEKGRLKLGKNSQLRHIMCYGFSLSFLKEKKVINITDDDNGGEGGLLKNLQTLIGLDVEFCVEDVLSMTPNLVTLGLSKGTISQNQLDILPLLLKRLQKLELHCQIGANSEICHQSITQLVLRCRRINGGGYLIRALRKLQNLRVLELLNGSISSTTEGEAGVLDFSSSDDDGFLRQLKFLKLEDLKGLKEWKMSVGVMPSLQKVSIIFCRDLERLPSEALKAIPTLQELELRYVDNEQALRDSRLVEEHLDRKRSA
ncbi:putative disease resistance RPP13-like protein 3 [Macadamia integrifolia]|uniref:putative disease resistance RPP13-like protein 3 n=1 Tax=Macadamia integrifolia TaxID=60698 RepID=UPI001C4F5583|nr:putative disease resistance RPP13-like protein 3 [Macadamia integrifolia]